MGKKNRFDIIIQEGNGLTSPQITVLMDTVTGVQYLFASTGNAGGMCPLLDRDGKPVAWDV